MVADEGCMRRSYKSDVHRVLLPFLNKGIQNALLGNLAPAGRGRKAGGATDGQIQSLVGSPTHTKMWAIGFESAMRGCALSKEGGTAPPSSVPSPAAAAAAMAWPGRWPPRSRFRKIEKEACMFCVLPSVLFNTDEPLQQVPREISMIYGPRRSVPFPFTKGGPEAQPYEASNPIQSIGTHTARKRLSLYSRKFSDDGNGPLMMRAFPMRSVFHCCVPKSTTRSRAPARWASKIQSIQFTLVFSFRFRLWCHILQPHLLPSCMARQPVRQKRPPKYLYRRVLQKRGKKNESSLSICTHVCMARRVKKEMQYKEKREN